MMFNRERQGSEASVQRKNTYKVVELSNLIAVFLITIAVLVADTDGYVCCSSYLGTMILACIAVEFGIVLVLLAVALCNFRRVLKG